MHLQQMQLESNTCAFAVAMGFAVQPGAELLTIA